MILEINGKKTKTSMTISEEDNGWLIDGIPGWHCPVMFQMEQDEDGIEIFDPVAIVREDGFGFAVSKEQFNGMNLELAILEYIESD